jgi:membrane protease YdiL (CAAX protease family)
MNEYDDLFHPRDPERSHPPILPQNEEEIQDIFYEQRINRLLLTLYFSVQILFVLGMALFKQLAFPNSALIYQNIVTVEAPSFSIETSDEDPVYPYLVTLRGEIQNLNTRILPKLFVSIEFYHEGRYLDEIEIFQEHVGYEESFSFNQSYYFSQPIDQIEYTYGFDFDTAFIVIFTLSQTFLLAILMVLVDRVNFKRKWREFRQNISANLGKISIGFILVYLALMASQVILETLGISEVSKNEETIASLFTADPLRLVLLFLLLCIFTPIVEEIIFRKVVFGFLDRRFGAIIAIIFSGAIFGIMHVISYGDFIQSIPYILMGTVFGFVYHWSKNNIYVTIGVHFINNLIAYLLYFVAVLGIVF